MLPSIWELAKRRKWHEETSLTEKIRHWRGRSRRSSSLPGTSKEGRIFRVLKLEVWSTQVKNEKSQAISMLAPFKSFLPQRLFKNPPPWCKFIFKHNSCQRYGAVALSCSSTSGDDHGIHWVVLEKRQSPRTSASTSTWMPYQKNQKNPSALLINSQHKTSSLFGSVTIFPDLCAILLKIRINCSLGTCCFQK